MGNLFAVAGSESLYLKWGKSVKVLQIQRQLVDMNVIFRPQLNNVHAIFMPPNFEEVQGAYWFDPARLSVTVSSGHDILRTV